MAIQLTNSLSQPALVYNNFFLERLELTQKLDTNNHAPPYYVLRVQYRLFAIDPEDTRHFQNKSNVIEITDYAAEAYKKALQGNMDLANASSAIEQALAKIIEDQRPEFGSATVI
jgi:hypothetical protein